MKKELLALMLLLGVIWGSSENLRCLRRFTAELDRNVTSAVSEAEAEHWIDAEALAAHAMENWTDKELYTHIFIRHGEIDGVTDGFCTLLGAIRSQDKSAIYAAQLALRNRIAELYEMERVAPGSIL